MSLITKDIIEIQQPQRPGFVIAPQPCQCLPVRRVVFAAGGDGFYRRCPVCREGQHISATGEEYSLRRSRNPNEVLRDRIIEREKQEARDGDPTFRARQRHLPDDHDVLDLAAGSAVKATTFVDVKYDRATETRVKAVTTADMWQRTGRITPVENVACEWFAEIYQACGFPGVSAVKWDREAGGGGVGITDTQVDCRRIFAGAVKAMGGFRSHEAAGVIAVIAEERKLKHWCLDARLNWRTGRRKVLAGIRALGAHYQREKAAGRDWP